MFDYDMDMEIMEAGEDESYEYWTMMGFNPYSCQEYDS